MNTQRMVQPRNLPQADAARPWRLLLTAAAALALGVLLMATWITALAGPAPMPPIAPVFAPSDYDLQIVKSQIPNEGFRVGTNNIYAISVQNVISIYPGLVVVEDRLPTGLTWTPANSGNWNCLTTSTSTLVSCYYAESSPSTYDLLSVRVNVPINIATTTFTNTARLIVNDKDGDINDSSTVTTTVDSVDLELIKTVNPTALETGQITYKLLVTNYGPADAVGVKVVDTWSTPAGGTLGAPGNIIRNPITTTYNITTSTWDIKHLAKGATASLEFVYNTTSTTVEGLYTNSATVTSDNLHEINSSDNTDTASVIVGQIPTPTPTPTATPGPSGPIGDLKVTKSQIPSTNLRVGTGNIYAILVQTVVSNTIPGLVVIEDQLPQGVTWTPANSGKWNCTTTSTSTLVSCYYTENDARIYDQLQIPVNVSRDVPSTSFKNSVKLIAADSDQTNNSDTITTTIDSVDLVLAKTVSPSNLVTGTVSYSLVITNTGPVQARGVTVDEDVPSYLTYLGSEGAGSYSPSAGLWTIGTLAADGGRATITLNFHTTAAAAGKVIGNTATARSTNYHEINGADNTASANIVVGGLQITKTLTAAGFAPGQTVTVKPGEPVTFTLRVRNPGVGAQNSVTVKDIIDPNLTIKRIPDGGSYSGNTFNYTIGTLNGGAGRTVRLVVAGSSSISNTVTITNAATLSWGSPTITVKSNEVQLDAIPGGALQVGKRNNFTKVNPGQYITYTVSITNTGNRTVYSPVITDVMGAFINAISVDPGDEAEGSCPNITYCRVDLDSELAPGEKYSFEVVTRVHTNAPTTGDYSIRNDLVASGIDDLSQKVVYAASDSDPISALPLYDLVIIKSVRPSQARVGDNLTFQIDVANQGSTTISGLKIFDAFDSVLDLTNVTTTRGSGTLNTSSKTVDVSIGALEAGQTVRVTIITKVNDTATDIETYDNRATLSWTGGELKSNIIYYRVLPKSTLPGTGRGGSGAVQASAPRFWMTVVIGGGLALLALGMALLGYSLYLRARHPLHAGAYTRGGLVLIVLGLFTGIAGLAIGSLPASSPSELALVTGQPAPTEAQPATSPKPRPTRTLPPTATPDLSQYESTPTPLKLPDYPVPSPTALVAEGPQGIEPDASNVTRLVVERMGLDSEVKYVPYDGQTWMIGGLKQEIAWMGDTSWPGLGGNTGLAGHVDFSNGDPGPFWNLKDLKPGDKIILYTQKNVYTYQVREQAVVNDYEMQILEQTANPQLTLITCVGWDVELRAYLQRLVIFADLSEVKPLQTSSN